MAEPISLLASVIAVVQLADQIIRLCKSYLKLVRDGPSDLRVMLLEISALKAILQNLKFLISCDEGVSAVLSALSGDDGHIEACGRALVRMESLFPEDHALVPAGSGSKKRRIKHTFTTLAWPLKESQAKKLLEEVMRHKASINLALTTDSAHDIKYIKNNTIKIWETLEETQRYDVYNWLMVTDPSPCHQWACKQHEVGTCDWIIRSDEWMNWLECRKNCIWVHGIPGAGKTILASYLIEKVKLYCELTTPKLCTCMYYYCYFGHKQDEALPFLRWIINQLCRQINGLPTCVYNLYRQGTTPSLVELLTALAVILNEEFDHVYIFVDAIDESMPRDDLLRVLRDLVTDSRFQKIQLFATSRRYTEIEDVMEKVSLPVSMTNPLLDADIRAFVRSQLRSLPKFKRWSPELLNEAEDALSIKAKGMFRWVVCQIDVLQKLNCSSNAIRNALASLPKTLDETYERIFLDIPEDAYLFVHHVLRWIYYDQSRQGFDISLELLLQAVERSMSSMSLLLKENYFYNKEILRELCGCLIALSDDKVSYAHYSVLEFLTSKRILNGPVAYFSVNDTLNTEFDVLMFQEVLDPNYIHIWERDTYENIRTSFIHDFNTFCIASCIRSVSIYQPFQRNVLRPYIFRLFDPLELQFQKFSKTCDFVSSIKEYTGPLSIERCCAVAYGLEFRKLKFFSFDDLKWVIPPVSTNVKILLNLLYVTNSINIILEFLKSIEIRTLFINKFAFGIRIKSLPSLDKNTICFEGSIMDLCCQGYSGILGNFEQSEFLLDYLFDAAEGLFDPSLTLISFIGSCWKPLSHQQRIYYLEHLLQLKVHPDTPGYVFTPLQVAVALYDLEGMRALLRAGALPNYVGNQNGIKGHEVKYLEIFNCFGGYSPLWICGEVRSKLERSIPEFPRTSLWDTIKKIEKTLLRYGAKSFREPWVPMKDFQNGLEEIMETRGVEYSSFLQSGFRLSRYLA